MTNEQTPKKEKFNPFEELQFIADITGNVDTTREVHKKIERSINRLNELIKQHVQLLEEKQKEEVSTEVDS